MASALTSMAVGGALLAYVTGVLGQSNDATYNINYDDVIRNNNTSGDVDAAVGGSGVSFNNQLCCLDLQQTQCSPGCVFNSTGNGSWAGQGGGEEASPPDMGPPLYMYIYVSLINGLVFLVGITGNVLVIQVVARIRSMRRRMNYFLVSLSVADLLVLLVGLPVALHDFYGKDRWLLGEAMCKIVPFLENMSHHCSVLTLLAIGFERYHAICNPLKESAVHRCTSVNVVIPSVWILSVIVSLPFAIVSHTEESPYYDNSVVEVCRTQWKSSLSKAYIIFIFSVCLVLPLVLLTIMYTAIILTLAVSNMAGLSASNGTGHAQAASKRSSTVSVNTVGSVGGNGLLAVSARHSNLPDTETVRHARVIASRRQVVRMMIAVMALYFCCLMPMRCFQLWVMFSSEADMERLGFERYLNLICIVRILIVLNSAGNPIIYGLLSSNFRSAFKQSLFNCRGRGQHDSYRYNTTYYSNSHHHHYLHQHGHGSPVTTRLSHLTTSAPSALNKNTRQRSLDSPQDTASLPLRNLRRSYEADHTGYTGLTTREPLLTASSDGPRSLVTHTADAAAGQNGSSAGFV